MASALLALLALGALGAEPLGRYSHCAVHLGSDMYIHGGRGFASTGDKRNLVLFGDMWVFSVDQVAWHQVSWDGTEDDSANAQPSPGSRSSHACAAVDDSSFLLFGGMTESSSRDGDGRQRLADDLWRFTLTSRTEGAWSLIKPDGDGDRPGSRSDHSLVAINSNLFYLIGGCNSRVAQPDAWRFSLQERTWELVPFTDELEDAADGTGGGEVAGSAGTNSVGASEASGRSKGRTSDGSSASAQDAAHAGRHRALAKAENSSLTDGPAGETTESSTNRTLPGLRLPGARCAHSASAAAKRSGRAEEEADVVLFGGRLSVTVQRDGSGYRGSEEMWSSLADTWLLHTANVARYLAGELDAENSGDDGDSDIDSGRLWERLSVTRRHDDEDDGADDHGSGGASGDTSESLLLNRSDHAALVHKQTLYVFGGLFTDLQQRTVYIMKDLVALNLKDRTWARLAWGPTWRFGHTMVNDPQNNRFILYGGAGGMEVFTDVWTFTYGTGDGSGSQGQWAVLNVKRASSQYPTLLMSILMGGAGFVLCVCMLLSLLFLRSSHRLFWSRRRGPVSLTARGGLGGTGPAVAPTASRGAALEAIEALPVLKWTEVVKFERQSGALVEKEEQLTAKGIGAQAQEDEQQSMLHPGDKKPRATGADEPGTCATDAQNGAAVGTVLVGGSTAAHPLQHDRPIQPRGRVPPGMPPPKAMRAAHAARGGSSGSAMVTASMAAAGSPAQSEAELAKAAEEAESEEARRSLDANLSCVVCLMEYDDTDDVCVLPCRHLFHKDCIHKWLRQEGSCPQCRHRIGAPTDAKGGDATALPTTTAAVASEPRSREQAALLLFPEAAGSTQAAAADLEAQSNAGNGAGSFALGLGSGAGQGPLAGGQLGEGTTVTAGVRNQPGSAS